MRRWLLDIPLLGVCLCLAPSRIEFGEPGSPVTGSASVDLSPGSALPTTTDLSSLAASDPVALLEASLRRYRDEVSSYTCILAKHERLGGKLKKPEVIRCAFREEPYSVLMHWTQGMDRAEMTLYVQGENANKVLIRPSPLLRTLLRVGGNDYADRPVDHPDVRNAARYSILEFGLAKGTERTYLAWKAAQERGILRTEYQGLQAVPEAGGRMCHVITRYCNPPEEEGLTAVTIAIDAENWLQVSSVLKAGNELIGSYHFRDIRLNPQFPANQFRPDILK